MYRVRGITQNICEVTADWPGIRKNEEGEYSCKRHKKRSLKDETNEKQNMSKKKQQR
jgi:hypothetical protein